MKSSLVILVCGLGGVAGWFASRYIPPERYDWSVAHIWNESNIHYSPEYIEAFASAADILTRELRSEFPSQISKVILMPTADGFDVCVLYDRKNARAKDFVAHRIDSLPHIREVLAGVLEARQPNKALVPTVTAVTPAADAPVAPAAPAAHL
jgi:hypothetical protein